MRVDIMFADKWVRNERTTGADGTRFYTLDDFYQAADLVGQVRDET